MPRGNVALLRNVPGALDPKDAVVDDGPVAERELTAADELRPPPGLGAADRHQTRASLEGVELLAGAVEDDAGPVMVTVEYRVSVENRAAFLAAINRFGHERKRDGAYAWGVFEDTAHPGRVLETFLVDSWLEHLRQHQRVTKADRALEKQVFGLAREEPRVTHYIAAE